MSLAQHDEILRSTVRLARLSFSAAAASVFLRDVLNGTLVFEASSGVGEDRLVGMSIPGDHGIAGWVANTGETMIIRDIADDGRFDRTFAEGTGLVPDIIMAVPMEHDGDILGVLEVLDPKIDGLRDLEAIDLLTELANQSSAALALLLEDRRMLHAAATGPDSSRRLDDPLARLLAVIERGETTSERRRGAARALLTAVADLLDPDL